MINQNLNIYYKKHLTHNSPNSIITTLKFKPNNIPIFSNNIYYKHLTKLNQISNFNFKYNNITLTTIHTFTNNHQNFTKIILNHSHIYFPIFKKKLSKHNLPLKLKYLSIIKNKLHPQIKSHTKTTNL